MINPWCHLYQAGKRPAFTNVPTHAPPLTRAHGPDTPGALPFPLSLSEPFAGEPSAGFQLPPLSVGVPPGLTFASKVSVFAKKIARVRAPVNAPDCISPVFPNAGRTRVWGAPGAGGRACGGELKEGGSCPGRRRRGRAPAFRITDLLWIRVSRVIMAKMI